MIADASKGGVELVRMAMLDPLHAQRRVPNRPRRGREAAKKVGYHRLVLDQEAPNTMTRAWSTCLDDHYRGKLQSRSATLRHFAHPSGRVSCMDANMCFPQENCRPKWLPDSRSDVLHEKTYDDDARLGTRLLRTSQSTPAKQPS